MAGILSFFYAFRTSLYVPYDSPLSTGPSTRKFYLIFYKLSNRRYGKKKTQTNPCSFGALDFGD
jgi:hypothetical protein